MPLVGPAGGVMRSFTTGILLLVMAGAIAAQERPDSARADSAAPVLPELISRVSRALTTVGGASGIRGRLDSVSLPAGATLEQVFRTIPLLHVRRNSRGEAELSGRGSESRQVAVLVDGVPLNAGWDGRADLSVIPATAAQSIDYVRGLSSMLHGPNVLGGVIELSVGQSPAHPEAASGELATEVDHVGGHATRALATIPMGNQTNRWLLRTGASFRDTPGQPLAGGIVEPVPGQDKDLRVNTDARHLDGFLGLRYQAGGGAWLSLSGSSFRARRGIAAELGVDNPRFWRYPHVSRSVLVVSGGTGDRGTPFGRGDLEASVGVDLGRTEIDAYSSRSYTEPSGFEDGTTRTLTARMLADHTLGPRGELRTAFTLSDIRHDEFLPEASARYRQRLWSAGMETAWRLIQNGAGAVNWLRLSTGAAWDLAETPETGGREPLGRRTEWGGRIGATAGLADGNTLIHGGISRRGRFASLRELYSASLDRFAPNSALRPERLVAMEAGVTTRIGGAELQAIGFHQVLSDAIVRITLPDLRFMRVNRNRLRSSGVELLFSTTLGPAAVGGDFTLQSVDLTDPVAGVTNRPENLPEAFGALHTAFPLPLEWRGFAEARFTGTQSCIDPGTGLDTTLDPGTVLNGELTRTWRLRSRGGGWFGRLETRLSVDNAGDTALYDQCGLPQPGRLWRVQLRIF